MGCDDDDDDDDDHWIASRSAQTPPTQMGQKLDFPHDHHTKGGIST